MLSLPYITECTEFQGQVYATEPTVQYARHFMSEMMEYIERTPKSKTAKRWKCEQNLKLLPLIISLDGMRFDLWLGNVRSVLILSHSQATPLANVVRFEDGSEQFLKSEVGRL